MSVLVSQAVWAARGLPLTDRLVLLALADHADEGGECWPSVARLVFMTELAESTVRRTVGRLERRGWVDVDRGGGRGHVSRYYLDLDRLGEAAPAAPPKGDAARPIAPARGEGAGRERGPARAERVSPTTPKGLAGRPGTVKEPPPEPSPPPAAVASLQNGGAEEVCASVSAAVPHPQAREHSRGAPAELQAMKHEALKKAEAYTAAYEARKAAGAGDRSGEPR